MDALAKRQTSRSELIRAAVMKGIEEDPKYRVLTLDSNFNVYRRNRQQVIPLLMPR